MEQSLPTSPPPNPYRPGNGHQPPYLAGREHSKQVFAGLLGQEPILKNLILTGLRGVGKTVLLDHLKRIAVERHWAWAGNDMSEGACVSEDAMATRVLADLAMISSGLGVVRPSEAPGFVGLRQEEIPLTFQGLGRVYQEYPGLSTDKLIGALRISWIAFKSAGVRGVVFAYDEAQNLTDKSSEDQYPMSVLLDAFSRLQREGLPYLLVLTGLPTLQGRLVEARTYSERMFTIEILGKLTPEQSRDAIMKPLEDSSYPLILTADSVATIVSVSAGYPYFIQYICRDVYDLFAQLRSQGKPLSVPMPEILARLDDDFYAGRWALVSDREQDLLRLIAALESCDTEFTMQQIDEHSIATKSRKWDKSTLNKRLNHLCELGLLYKVRYGRYTFGVPMLGQFIQRRAGLG